LSRDLELTEVVGRRDWRAFHRLPRRIYAGDPNWVAPLLVERKTLLSPRKNPFFRRGEARAWIARAGDGVRGRILAFVDPAHNAFHRDRTGFVGFFECVDDRTTAEALFDRAADWLRARGMDTVRGPVDLSLMNECGLLTSGYDSQPFVQMRHSPPYYLELFENWGFRPSHRLLAYHVTTDAVRRNEELSSQLQRVSERLLDRERLSVRPLDLGRFEDELRHVTRIYNASMRENWGFVPASEAEMSFVGKSLRLVVDPELVSMVEMDGEVVACALPVPDVNAVPRRSDGRLSPLFLARLLYRRRTIRRLRLMLIGVVPSLRTRGIDALLLHRTIAKAVEKGYETAELSWISESNVNLISLLDKVGASLYKTYCVYDRELS